MNTEQDKNHLPGTSRQHRSTSISTPLSNTNAPLQRPTMRLQDGDIILEDADDPAEARLSTPGTSMARPRSSSPLFHDATPQPPMSTGQSLQHPPQFGVSPVPALDLSLLKQRKSSSKLSHNNTASNNHTTHVNSNDVKIRSISNASRFRTPNDTNIGSFKLPTIEADTPPNDDPKKKTIGGLDSIDAIMIPRDYPSGASKKNAAENVPIKELTLENVEELAARMTESNKAIATERLWRWLTDAGPPYEGHASLGVSSLKPMRTGGGSKSFGKGNLYSGGDSVGRKGVFASCFGCFSVGSGKSWR